MLVAQRKDGPAPSREQGEPVEDGLEHGLTKEERAKLAMDAWEPSLLRRLLSARNELGPGRRR